MKAKKIFNMVKQLKNLHVLTLDDRQFFEIGGGIYLIDGMPNMENEEFLAYLDVPKSQRNEWNVTTNEVDETLVSDVNDEDCELKPHPISIVCGGRSLTAFLTEDGTVLWLDEDKMSPLAAAEWTFFLRHSETGESYIAVKEGLYLIALLCYELTPEVMPGETLAGRLMELAGAKDTKNE